MSPDVSARSSNAHALKKGPNAIDAHVGSRLRLRRVEQGMTQEKLADAFGLTFQQVQKCEKGMNRMGSSRLQHAASILNVPVSYFFEGGADGPFESPNDLSPSYIDNFVTTSDGPAARTACLATPHCRARERGSG
jgi:transcriptional regulator with XRE-family HTH domain